jgi:hypothetical protein
MLGERVDELVCLVSFGVCPPNCAVFPELQEAYIYIERETVR